MRAFHCSWFGLFMAFFIWFSIAPLLSEIRDTLELSNPQIWTSSIVGVGGTMFIRCLLVPLCDKYGARLLFAIVLCVASIPTACTGLIHSATDLIILRLVIGIAGGSFAMSQYWASRMFAKQAVGTATALVAGWGNLGAGVTQVVVGSILFPLFKLMFAGDASQAWRTVCIVPGRCLGRIYALACSASGSDARSHTEFTVPFDETAFIAFATGVAIYFISDDAPVGNYDELKKHGNMPDISAVASFRSGAINLNTWILFLQYGCCFGVELTMNNAAALYFKDEFGQSTESAAAIASIFGWMNLFARGAGGYLSEKANERMGMRGRIVVQLVLLLVEGGLVFLFAQTQTLWSSIAVMVFFAVLAQAAEGSTFGIVPYVDPRITSAISGIVGAGGNSLAVVFGVGFRQLNYQHAFRLMGATILASGILSVFLHVTGHAMLLWGSDSAGVLQRHTPSQTLTVPQSRMEIEQEVENDDLTMNENVGEDLLAV